MKAARFTDAQKAFVLKQVGRSTSRKSVEFTARWSCNCGTDHQNGGEGQSEGGSLGCHEAQ